MGFFCGEALELGPGDLPSTSPYFLQHHRQIIDGSELLPKTDRCLPASQAALGLTDVQFVRLKAHITWKRIPPQYWIQVEIALKIMCKGEHFGY